MQDTLGERAKLRYGKVGCGVCPGISTAVIPLIVFHFPPRLYDYNVTYVKRYCCRRYWLLTAKNEMANSTSGLGDSTTHGTGSTGRMSFSGRSIFSNLSFGKRKPFLNIRSVRLHRSFLNTGPGAFVDFRTGAIRIFHGRVIPS